MPTRNVVLTDHQNALVNRLVSAGSYQNASEVLREGLRLLERRAADDQARIAALRASAKVGLGDIAAGRVTDFDRRDALAQHLSERSARVLSRTGRVKRTA